MRSERAFLENVVESLADGTDIDWAALEARIDSDGDRRVLEQLKILARIAEVHRSHANEPDDEPLLRSRPFGGGLGGSLGGKVIPIHAHQAGEAFEHDGRSAAVDPSRLTATQVVPVPAGPPHGRWGHLELLERIGDGTFGEVYRARDTQLDREVAVKLLRAGGLSTDRQTRRALREGRSLARVDHDNVVAVYGAEAHGGRVGLWMELIRGATLEQLLKGHGPFSAREAALIGQDLCSAVSAVHNAGLVHRDIKAQNVMREEGGRLVLMDFGAGQFAGDTPANVGRLTGTPLYLAPEVLAGGDSTPQSDIYSIGVLLYHLVTGEYPARVASLQELREAHAQGRRVHLHDARPELHAGLTQVIERALESDATRRYRSAGEMRAALDRVFDVSDDRDDREGRAWLPVPAPVAAWLRRMGRARAIAAMVAAGLVLLVLGAALAWQAFRNTGAIAPAPPRVIAVLDLARGPGVADYESAGVTEGIHDLLSTIDTLRVVSRRSVQVVSRKELSTPDLATQLGVDTLIEGRLDRTGDTYGATIRLIRAGSDQSIAIGTFRAPIEKRLSLPSPVVEAIAKALQVRLPTGTKAHLSAGGSFAAEAQEKYTRARYYLNTSNHAGHRDQATRLFEEAIQLAPDFAEAHAGLARTYYGLAATAGAGERTSLLARAHEQATRALTLDSTLAEGEAVLGAVSFYQWRWTEAEQAFTRAVMLNPSHEFAVERYAMFLAARGRVDEGLALLLQLRKLDPLSPTAAYSTATVLQYAGRYDEALREVQRARSLDPTDLATELIQGRILAASGRFDDAIVSFRRVFGSILGVNYAMVEIAAAEAGAGRRDEAIRLVEGLQPKTDEAKDPLRPELIAFVYAQIGDLDRAFSWLQRAFDEQSARVLWLKVDPRARPLRGDPRFAALLARLDLEP